MMGTIVAAGYLFGLFRLQLFAFMFQFCRGSLVFDGLVLLRQRFVGCHNALSYEPQFLRGLARFNGNGTSGPG